MIQKPSSRLDINHHRTLLKIEITDQTIRNTLDKNRNCCFSHPLCLLVNQLLLDNHNAILGETTLSIWQGHTFMHDVELLSFDIQFLKAFETRRVGRHTIYLEIPVDLIKPEVLVMSKLNDLALQYGYNSIENLMQEYIIDSICPGICTNPECNYTTEVEPDQQAGWCEECNTPTVKSAMILAGVI